MKGDTMRRVEELIQNLDAELLSETGDSILLAYAEACEEVASFFSIAARAAREEFNRDWK
jgi:hypothetical protein